ncbi:hypothetical protein FNV43_RR09970 [Rhamnella rubrinervis]|uniref:Late embryogenesis abundant protein LEA-2 subgroup domain-containing protein n=1 Tax=Rhamnella rubrinervis TaxID=2594499 RepID=A0A8K0MKG0_9ROSA|nr:hypothetical protein FNV43_RR09970 [Rhamnella rubrinervis]
MPKPRFRHGPERRTHPLIWLAAVICTVIALAVIIVGIVVFVGYLVSHPRVPVITVFDAHLDKFSTDMAGLLETQVTIQVKAENDNSKANASFSDTRFTLSFQGITIAQLVADPFEVKKNDSLQFYYVVPSSSIPLDPQQMEEVDLALKQDVIMFDFKGEARARWRVWLLGSLKFWCHLNCQLKFHPLNGTYMNAPCSSRAK